MSFDLPWINWYMMKEKNWNLISKYDFGVEGESKRERLFVGGPYKILDD